MLYQFSCDDIEHGIWNISLSSNSASVLLPMHMTTKNWITKFGTSIHIKCHIRAEMILLRLTPIFELSSNEIRFLDNRKNCSLINNKSDEITKITPHTHTHTHTQKETWHSLVKGWWPYNVFYCSNIWPEL